MVHSSALTVFADGEHLACDGFSLNETVHLRSYEFIIDYFIGLSLSPRRNDLGNALMGSSRNGPPSP
jgi:hypothetical protein